MIPRFRPPFQWQDILKVPFSGDLAIFDWEKRLAQAAGYEHAVWFPYGRTAVRAYLETLSPRSTVVLSPYNCSALASAIVASRAKAVFVDTEPEGFNQDSALFKSALRVSKKRVGILVHQWGIRPAPVTDIDNPVLHDKALCDFSETERTLKKEDAVLHSFGWGKPMAGLRGAILCGGDEQQARAWAMWRDDRLAQASPLKDTVELASLKLALSPVFFGLTRRLGTALPLARQLSGKTHSGGTALPANWDRLVATGVMELLWSQIENREEQLAERKEQIDTYGQLLSSLSPGLLLPPKGAVLSHYPILVEERDALHRHLLKHGVFSSTQLFDRLLCDLPGLRSIQVGKKPDFPNARLLSERCLHLPLYPGLTRTEQNKIAAVISGWHRKKRTETPCYSTITDANSSTIRS